uniref:Intraflagellar transport protein 46 homolog n=1 Tax=Chrysotila carterae TaxID=13221 RepID=A0A7S4FCA5_CHRCT
MAEQEEEEFSSADEEERRDDRRDLDDDFDGYPESPPPPQPPGMQSSGQIVNQPFDEAHELSDEDDGSPERSRGAAPAQNAPSRDTVKDQPWDEAVELTSDEDEGSPKRETVQAASGYSAQRNQAPRGATLEAPPPAQAPNPPPENLAPLPQSTTNFADAAGSVSRNFNPNGVGDDGSDGEANAVGGGEGLYDPAEYEHLGVSQDISELFQYITRYKPHNIELETKMKPFIPDYIPAVGDIDPFVKVPRPDAKPDNLGLSTMDEPATNQSDPTVFTLQLRAVTKSSGAQPMPVQQVELAEKNPKQISKWITSINDLHRHKPAPTVRYSKPMPDVEALMQIWPAKFEELLESARLPDAELGLELGDLVRVMCGILDIPVYSSLTESLHVMFTLYSDFKANVHFQQQLADEGGAMQGGVMMMN